MHIHHVTLPSGQIRVTPLEDAKPKVLSLVAPWLDEVLRTGARKPLALPAVSHFSGSAVELQGALRCSIWRPQGSFRPERPHLGNVTPLATLGVARDAESGALLWAQMQQRSGQNRNTVPNLPWCAVLPDATGMAAHPKASLWLDELQCSIAFAWLAREPIPRPPRAHEFSAPR
jgi:hypothetical protein